MAAFGVESGHDASSCSVMASWSWFRRCCRPTVLLNFGRCEQLRTRELLWEFVTLSLLLLPTVSLCYCRRYIATQETGRCVDLRAARVTKLHSASRRTQAKIVPLHRCRFPRCCLGEDKHVLFHHPCQKVARLDSGSLLMHRSQVMLLHTK